MADGVDFDLSEVAALALTIGRVQAVAIPAARAVVAKGALNIKNDTRDNVSKNPTWKRLAATVNYTMAGNGNFAEAIVGYDDVGQGELAGIYEFGSAHRAPHPTLYPAAARETPAFEKAMAAAIIKATEAVL